MSAAAVVVLLNYLFILAPKRRPEQTSRIFLLRQEREDVAKLQPSANLCLYSHELFFMYKKWGENLFEGKLPFSNFKNQNQIVLPGFCDLEEGFLRKEFRMWQY